MPSNAGRNYASTRGEQPYIERVADWTMVDPAATPPKSLSGVHAKIFALVAYIGSGKSSFIQTLIEDNAEVSDMLQLRTAIPTYPITSNGLNIHFLDTPGFEDTNKSDTGILKEISWLSQSYTLTHKVAGIMYLHKITGDNMEISAISNCEASNPDAGQGRTALYYALEKWRQSLVPFDSTADNFGTHFHFTTSCDWATDPNYEEADLRNDRMRHFRCPDEDDMSSVSSNDQESLFDYCPSESDTTTTVDSRAFQLELTDTNIEHLILVLKAERGKCLGELRELDAALEAIDQLTNRKRPGSSKPNSTYAAPPDQNLYCFSACRNDYENPLREADVNAGITLKNKRMEFDSSETARLAFSDTLERIGASPPANRKNESRTAAITLETAAASATAAAAIITTHGQNPLGDMFLVEQSAKACLVEMKTKCATLYVSKSKMTEPKLCLRCPKTVKDTPALKRHCSEVHKEDIDGSPISVELFPCPITTCHKHTEPFKRREKLAKHIRTFHTEIIEGREVNGGISSGERDAALTTNNTAEVGNGFGGNRGVVGLSPRAHHDSAEVGVWYPTVFDELLSPPEEVQSVPVTDACEMVLCYTPNIPVDANFQPSSTSKECNGDTISSFLDSPSMYTFWDSSLEVDVNRTIGDAAEIPYLARMPNEGSSDFHGVIDPALMQSFPSGGKLPNPSSPSDLPELRSDLLRQISTGGWPVAGDKTVTVQYDTIDEAKQALQDARQKTIQKLQFIDQQIENLEGRKLNRIEAVGGLESVKGGFL